MFSLIFQSNHSNKTHPPKLFNTRKLNDLVVTVGREEKSGCVLSCLNQIHVFLKTRICSISQTSVDEGGLRKHAG